MKRKLCNGLYPAHCTCDDIVSLPPLADTHPPTHSSERIHTIHVRYENGAENANVWKYIILYSWIEISVDEYGLLLKGWWKETALKLEQERNGLLLADELKGSLAVETWTDGEKLSSARVKSIRLNEFLFDSHDLLNWIDGRELSFVNDAMHYLWG